jgi:hypothetical protein
MGCKANGIVDERVTWRDKLDIDLGAVALVMAGQINALPATGQDLANMIPEKASARTTVRTLKLEDCPICSV